MKSPLVVVSTGGAGGFYGGGGGGCGGIRSKGGVFVPGKGGDGVIIVNWTPAGLAGLGLTSIGTLGVQMILGADGRPLARSVLLLNTIGIGYRCGIQLLRQTEGWYSGVKAVWVPNGDGTLHDILWASFDQDEPVPDWVRRVPWFTMATAVLTTASVSPWTVDGTWNASNNSVEMLGAGGNGAAGGTGANSVSGAGGGGGAYTKLINGAVSGTVPFRVATGGSGSNNGSAVDTTGATCWENTTPTNCYVACTGLNALASGGGSGGNAVNNQSATQGSPSTSFTVSVNDSMGGNGATTNGANTGGGGGGGTGGPLQIGGAAGVAATGNGGSGGGGANNGTSGNGVASSGTITGGNGGQGSTGSPGTTGTTTGANGTGNSGGRGSDGSASAVNLTGGQGGSGTDFDASHGLGGGGGGSGQCTSSTTQTSTGGNGGLYGGGGGGTGGCRGTSSTRTAGTGAAGVIFITWGTLMGAMVM